MPPTAREAEELCIGMLTYVIAPDYADEVVWNDGTRITDLELNSINKMGAIYSRCLAAIYFRRYRKARKLFRSVLSHEDLQFFIKRQYVRFTGSSGNVYDIFPQVGTTYLTKLNSRGKIERVGAYCYHSSVNVPVADISVAHYLILKTDEARFLSDANFRHRHETQHQALERIRQQNPDRAIDFPEPEFEHISYDDAIKAVPIAKLHLGKMPIGIVRMTRRPRRVPRMAGD